GVMPVDGFCRTAEIEVNPGGAELRGKGGVLRHNGCLPAHDLDMHRHASRRFAARSKLGAELVEDGRRIDMLADPHKFTDAEIKAADLRQHIAHINVDDPFHRGERESCHHFFPYFPDPSLMVESGQLQIIEDGAVIGAARSKRKRKMTELLNGLVGTHGNVTDLQEFTDEDAAFERIRVLYRENAD